MIVNGKDGTDGVSRRSSTSWTSRAILSGLSNDGGHKSIISDTRYDFATLAQRIGMSHAV